MRSDVNVRRLVSEFVSIFSAENFLSLFID